MAAFAGPSVEELTELRRAIARLERDGAGREATVLGRLLLKLEAITPRAALRRMEPDVEALAAAAGFGLRPGPREAIGPGIFEALQRAVLEMRTVRLRYRRRDTGAVSRPILHPHGFLWGPRRYLVATNPHPKVNEARTYVLANIEAVELLDEAFAPDLAFDLAAFVDRSFGVFWDGRAFDVAWRFAPSAAADARAFLFHATQTFEDEPDGSLLVRFRASGLDEMGWHLFTWGDAVRVVEPPELAARYRALIERARRASADGEEAGT
ncbi:helix-turn-helix transcriptional regulator [Salinarimonas rosea]|uniref:helix-turn-helix transcriptional regulator n=1 Tax=Salinarimonas rosea TaxID=552063 RepID=UPI00041FC8AF|nr:WYL domain-containing protein [Salinarimonas rosea]